MSDRSEEVTTSRESKSTEELLEETQSILSDTGSLSSGDGGHGERADADRERGSMASASEPATGADERASSGGSSWLPSFPSLSLPTLRRYFSPKAYLAFVLLVGIGLLVGGSTIPFAGRMVGIFAVAFFLGLVTAKRRYLEMGAAGVSAGAIGATFNYTLLVIAGAGMAPLTVGVTAGLLASVGGYYFGRDLKNGLTGDLE